MNNDKYLKCQVTEILHKDFPQLVQFYQFCADKYPFLLSTSSKNDSDKTNTFDILFIDPQEWLKLDHRLKLSSSAQYDINPEQSFLDNFDKIFNAEKNSRATLPLNDHHLPFTGGWFVFFAYELAQQIEPCLKLKFSLTEAQDSSYNKVKTLPIAYASRIRKALVLDHQKNKRYFISEADLNHRQAYDDLLDDVQSINEQLEVSHTATQASNKIIDSLKSDLEEETADIFLDGVKKVKDYIKEGDVFQVNLSRHWQVPINNKKSDKNTQGKNIFSTYSSHLYKLLSQSNPAPFSGLAHFFTEQGDACIISSSPERLLKVRNKQLESRPIAGTHPRSESMAEDLRLIDELHQHPKEQAEHIMLIDLIRNDLGKVCVPGSVAVNELMVNETYAHVHHIVSNVIGQLQDEVTPGDIIKALFPGGTITGCPKIRCMEIIAELEDQPRGAYTGSMGYINLDGSMDLNILIRTMVLQQSSEKFTISFRAGAGLVDDSIANKELQETRVKAMGLIRALP